MTSHELATPANEFSGRILLIASAAIGLSTGMTATMFYSMGAFIAPLQAEFGWDRGSISLAVTIMTVALFLAGPWVGRLCDRYGAAMVASASLCAYALAVIAMAVWIDSLAGFWIAYFVIAILGAGSTPIALVRPITAHFRARRGLALGIVLTGAGIAGFWVPNVVAPVAEGYGWRAAYIALAGTALVAAPLVWFGFRGAERGPLNAQDTVPSDVGMSAAEARRQRSYWLLSAMAVSMAMGIAGIIVHLVPLFQDFGATPADAARTASLVGLSSVVGRIVIGHCLDRFVAAHVSMVILAAAMIGLLLLWATGTDNAIVAVILLGLAAGAEIDLLAYLTAKIFGQRAYGAIYGWQYSVFALGYGLGPFLVGRLRDVFGTYDFALLASAAMMGVSACLAFALGAATQGAPASRMAQ